MAVPAASMSPEATPSAIARDARRSCAPWFNFTASVGFSSQQLFSNRLMRRRRRLLPNLHPEPDLRSPTAIQSRPRLMIECALRTHLMRCDRLYKQIRISSSQSSG